MRGRGVNITSMNLALTGAVFIAALFFATFPAKAHASEDHLVINEVYAVPASSIEQDWVEIYNPTGLAVNIAEYFLLDDEKTSKPFYLSGLISGDILGASEYLVLEKNTTGFTFDLSSTVEAVLLENPLGIVDQMHYGSGGVPTPSVSESISRIPNAEDTDNDKNDFKIMPATKGFENTSPAPKTYSDKIYINEILPQPAISSDDEYIELFNKGSEGVDLSGWRLDDATAGSDYTIPPGTEIKGGGYLVFCKNSSSTLCDFNYKTITLNDTSADSAILIDPNGDIKSTVSYGKTIRGQSYSLFGSSWQWTTSATPGSENIYTLETPIIDEDTPIFTTDITTARLREDGETVKVEGTVSVAPGILSSQYFYIQDDLSGIQVYSYDKTFPDIHAGDTVSVVGELSTTSNERRIKIFAASDIIVIRQNSPPNPLELKIADISEEYEGRFVAVFGTVSKTSGNTFYIHGSGEIEVIIRDGTGIKKPKMSSGNRVMVSGILSQYRDHYRILPISKDGVRILTSGQLPESGCDKPSDNINLDKLWKLRLNQPMRRKKLVKILAKA